MAKEEEIWAWDWRYGWGKLVQSDKSMSGSDPRKKDTHAKSPSDGTEENESMYTSYLR